MGKGVLYKSDGKTWSKSQAKDTGNNSSTYDEGKIQHYMSGSWHDNYPMEQLYEQYFNVVWTHGYKMDGTKLDQATWGDHPRSGDGTANFVGMFGFDRTAMRNFVASGVIKGLQIEVMFDDPSHSGNPVVEFAPHIYTAKPTSYSGMNVNLNYKATSQFNQTGADYKRWITLPVGAWLNGSFSGVFIRSPQPPTAANSARFAGKTSSHSLNSFNTRVWIQVLK